MLEEEISPLSDDELRAETSEFKNFLADLESLEKQREVLDNILPEAFAVVREAAKRVLGMRRNVIYSMFMFQPNVPTQD